MTTFSRVDRCPEEVEDVFMMHPAIYDVVVISVDDLKRGQQLKAVVRVKPEVRECSDLAADIIDYARDRVAHEKAPQRVDFVNDIPRTAAGEFDRRELELS